MSLCSLAGDLNEFKTKAYQTIQSVLDSHDGSSHSLSEWHQTVLGKRRDGSAASVNIETSYQRTKDSTVEQQSSMTDVGSVVQEGNIASAAENESLDERTREFIGKAEASNTGSTVAFRSGFHGDVSEHRQSDDADQSMNRHSDDSSLDGARERNLGEVRGGSHGNRGHVTAGDTVIYPLVQMGPLGITVDQEVTRQMLGEGDEASTCYLASGYFNLTSEYMDTIIQSNATYEILMASPQVSYSSGS